jgi:Flp pilus assembly protein CpaB
MSTQVRPPRTRSSGGRTLMLLGVLLALAAGTIVIYVVSAAVGPTTRTTTVVVANESLPASTILSNSVSDNTHTLISAAFTTQQVNADFVPDGAYVFSGTTQLNTDLNDQVVVGQFYKGDILRQKDPRLVSLGQAAVGSLTLRNPAQLPKGDVLFPLKVDSLQDLSIVPGDHIDILATYCIVNGVASGNVSGCPGANNEVQTTLENKYVYAVSQTVLYVVVTHEDALTLKLITETGKWTVVLRAAGDTDPDNTNPVDGQYIYQHFHFKPQ